MVMHRITLSAALQAKVVAVSVFGVSDSDRLSKMDH